MMRVALLIGLILITELPARATPPQDSSHPRWIVGDWCYPRGRPLRLNMGGDYLPNERTSYYADGWWETEGEGGTWRVLHDRLTEIRTKAEPWTLSKGERVRKTWTRRLRRHGPTALELRGRGWMVKCPAH